MSHEIPKMTSLQSTNLYACGHDGKALYIQFRGAGGMPGNVYRYPTAGADVHDALLVAHSPGRHFQQVIKSAHRGEKVG